MGGNLADQNAGMSGVRRISLADGQVTMIDDGLKNITQSDIGGMAIDDKYLYWNGGGNILRVSTDGGKPEVVTSENVGIGIDLAIDKERVYWANHGYYSPGQVTQPKPVYSAPKGGGKTEVFADQQAGPHCLAVDENAVYWLVTSGIVKMDKKGGKPQPVHNAADGDVLDELSQDGESLYFGFLTKGESRWGLGKIAKSGGQAVVLKKQYSLKPTVIDETNVYFFDEDASNDALCRMAKNGGEVTRIDSGFTNGAIAQNKTHVLFAAMDTIFSTTK